MSGRKRGRQPVLRVGRGRQVLRGLVLLGTGRARGFDRFDGGPDSVLAALAPPLGFLVVLGALLVAQRPTAAAGCLMLLLVCAVLMPPVLSHLLARIWKREAQWPRYAAASAWSVWLVLPAYVPAMIVASVLLQLGVSRTQAGGSAMLLLGLYMLWLQWFLAWKGLAISRIKAVLTVVVLGAAQAVLAAGLQPLLQTVLLTQTH